MVLRVLKSIEILTRSINQYQVLLWTAFDLKYGFPNDKQKMQDKKLYMASNCDSCQSMF
jgi:hypothetical protein